ncbi:hypothetical protein [Pyxidicoccus xibeiensis]|uniref:hypothetical protein n=1 Tax=Pyxidicoccus xibeiensis TaxID=2906759 RepID=UPI0020A7F494|nr:hypothetical protein [Pyxidicoccus xibeiensis]MCP3140361.1 hypothetical protein [Pyxidicoccus xibeiensis]
MASSTLLVLLGIAVLQGTHRRWAQAVGGLALVAGVVVAVRAQGLAVGLTCSAVLAMLATAALALSAPLWPRATRLVLPLGAVGLALLWLGAS